MVVVPWNASVLVERVTVPADVSARSSSGATEQIGADQAERLPR